MVTRYTPVLAVLVQLACCVAAARLFPPHLAASPDPLFPLFCAGGPAGLYLGGLLPNTSITASSAQEGHEAVRVRGGVDGYWRPENASLQQKDRFVQVDLGETRQIAGLLASTEMGEVQTKAVMVRYSQDCTNFEFLRDDNGVRLRIELGLRHVNHTWQVFFPRVVVARCIAVTPLADSPSIGPSLELDIVVCGFSRDGVKEEDLAAEVTPSDVTSQWVEMFREEQDQGFSYYKLGASWWHYSGSKSLLTMKVSERGESRIIFGVQGAGTRIGGTTVSYSIDCSTYWPITDDEGNPLVFQLSASTKSLFPNPVRAKCLQISPTRKSFTGTAEVQFLIMTWYTGLRATCGMAIDVGYPALVAPPPETSNVTVVDWTPTETEAPFIASVNMCSDIEGCHVICSATFIASQWLVTSKACLTDQQGEALSVDSLRVKDGSGTSSRVAATRAHPEHDVAVIKLSEPVTLTPKVLPACLADKTTFRMDGLRCTVVSHVADPGEVCMSVMPTISSEECQDFFSAVPEFSDRIIDREQMCLGFANDTRQACNASPGAGVFCYDLSPTRWTLHGVVSWPGAPCSDVTVTTWLPNFSEWIQDTVSAHLGPVIPTV